MQRIGEKITDTGVSYSPTGPNSNTVVKTMIEKGLGIKSPIDELGIGKKFGITAPGFDDKIPIMKG